MTRVRSMESEIVAMIEALRELGDNDLAGRLWRCSRSRDDKRLAQQMGITTGWAKLCRSQACPSCRKWLSESGRRKAARQFQHADGAVCSHVTIMLARTSELGVVQEVVRQLRIGLRNLRDRKARQTARWASVEAYGSVEVDALCSEDVPVLPPQRKAVVEALPTYGTAAVMWLPHAHLSVHHPDVDRNELRDALAQQWTGPAERVNVRPFEPGSAGENTGNLYAYATKADMRTQFTGWTEMAWPISWQASYWSWLCGMKNGMAPLRLKMGPMCSQE